jgi:hypothetical protein
MARQPGALRKQLARALNAAYAGGLLSENTFEHRVDHVLTARLIDPLRMIGDLNGRASILTRASELIAAAASRIGLPIDADQVECRPVLLALDWNGGAQELLLGRSRSCDLTFSNLNVSRRHALLVFRDGSWILRDLESTNGTFVNGVRVHRCELRPGDWLELGDEALRVD